MKKIRIKSHLTSRILLQRIGDAFQLNHWSMSQEKWVFLHDGGICLACTSLWLIVNAAQNQRQRYLQVLHLQILYASDTEITYIKAAMLAPQLQLSARDSCIVYHESGL